MDNFQLHVPHCNTASAASGNSSQVPKRDEIDDAAKWKLTDLYATEAAFEQDIEEMHALTTNLSQFKGLLADASNLAECLALRDAIGVKAGMLFAYARMSRDTDAANAQYQAITAQMEALLAEVSGACAFIDPELLTLPEKGLIATVKNTPALHAYQFYIEDLLRQKKHILSPVEEELLARTSELRQAPSNIYTILTNADLEFPETMTESGEKSRLSEGRYNAFIRSQNREVRKDAFENLFQTYAKYRNTFATTLNSTIKNAMFYAKTKKYGSTLEAALKSGNIPINVYDNVIETTHKNLSYLHKYISLKKERLQLEELHMYDLYVPIAKEPPGTFAYEDGLKLVADSLQPLGDQYISDLLNGARNGWIDIYENRGKRTGAYSWGVFNVHPFILLNYDNRYGAVSTLAHELGHAMHSYYSNRSQPYVNSSYTIFCAEVASTTNEILLLDHMLKLEKDPQKRISFINQYLEQMRTTVYRQVMFAEFERITHKKAEQGKTLTADLLENIWLDLNRQYYGDEIVLDDAVKIEWARIPHFYRPFYVYQYATGYAAATTMASNLIDGTNDAQKRYLRYLQSGGSDYSLALLKHAGVDMATATPLTVTFEKFNTQVKELEKFSANA